MGKMEKLFVALLQRAGSERLKRFAELGFGIVQYSFLLFEVGPLILALCFGTRAERLLVGKILSQSVHFGTGGLYLAASLEKLSGKPG